MKEGVKVKVTACFTGHEFDIGEVVMRKYLEEEHSEMCLGFVDDKGSSWYMSPEEYEVCGEVSECGWVSVENRLPQIQQCVIVYAECDHDFAYFGGQAWVEWHSGSVIEVTHWMPLPEPPK